MQQPEAYVGGVTGLLDAEGRVANPGTRDLLKKFAEAFAAWVQRFGG